MASEKIAFTRKVLADVGPSPKRTSYKDQDTRGLILDVTPNGVKSFRVYRKIRGVPERITLGRFNAALPDSREFPQGTDLLKALLAQPELNVKMARRLAEAVNVQLDAGNNPAETKRVARGELTLGEMFEKYMADHAIPQKLRSIKTMRENFERYLGEMPDCPVKKHGVKREKSPFGVNWQNRKLSSIKPEEVRKLHTGIGAVRAASTANHILDLLQVLYKKASDWGEFSGQSPTVGCKPFPEVSRDRFLSADELLRFWKAVDEETSVTYRDYVLLSILHGARAGNTIAMKWADIDMDAAEWRVPDTESKNKGVMRVVLVPEVIEILQRRKEAEDVHAVWVFPADSESGHMSRQHKRWKALLKRADIKDLRFHDLRRSLGSWQARTGASMVIIGKSLGHKSLQATAVYARLDTDPIRESVTRATVAMRSAGRGQPAQVVNIEDARKVG